MKRDLLFWVSPAALVVGVTGLVYSFMQGGHLEYLLYGVVLSLGFVAGYGFSKRQSRIERECEIRAQEDELRAQEDEIRAQEEQSAQKAFQEGRTQTFKPGPDDSYNKEFYTYFQNRLKGAKRSIYITGEGFECKDEEGVKIAQSFIDAHMAAMSSDLKPHIDRIQTKSLISKKWADMLQGLLQGYSGQFRLYLEPRQTETGPIVSVCVIDPDSDVNSTVELMVSVSRIVYGEPSDKAGIAFFREYDKEFAQDMLAKISEARKNSQWRQITSLDDSVGSYITIDGCEYFQFDPVGAKRGLAEGYTFYFTYGSNMIHERMMSRCPSAEMRGRATLVGHRLVFNRKGDYVDGGVASVIRDPGRNVYGMIYALNADDLENLDEAEVKTSYRRVEKSVLNENGELADCQLYVTFPQGDMEADQSYLEGIIAAAKEAGLPDGYIEELRQFRV